MYEMTKMAESQKSTFPMAKKSLATRQIKGRMKLIRVYAIIINISLIPTFLVNLTKSIISSETSLMSLYVAIIDIRLQKIEPMMDALNSWIIPVMSSLIIFQIYSLSNTLKKLENAEAL